MRLHIALLYCTSTLSHNYMTFTLDSITTCYLFASNIFGDSAFSSFTLSPVLFLDCPKNIPFLSMTNSSEVIVPSSLPFARISILFASTLPITLPLIMTFWANISPATTPVFPIITVFLERIVPSNSPSV